MPTTMVGDVICIHGISGRALKRPVWAIAMDSSEMPYVKVISPSLSKRMIEWIEGFSASPWPILGTWGEDAVGIGDTWEIVPEDKWSDEAFALIAADILIGETNK